MTEYRKCDHGTDTCAICSNVPNPGYEYMRQPVEPAGGPFESVHRYVHARIDDLHRQASRLAPRATYEAADSGCTNHRPQGPRQARAWDLIEEAGRLNAISEDDSLLAAEGLTRYQDEESPEGAAASRARRAQQAGTRPAPVVEDVKLEGRTYASGDCYVVVGETTGTVYDTFSATYANREGAQGWANGWNAAAHRARAWASLTMTPPDPEDIRLLAEAAAEQRAEALATGPLGLGL